MTTQHIETLIIGAGQAGLSTGYHLQRLGRPFLIVDGNERVGDNWRQQWDTLRLYSPAKYDGLPGLPFPAPPWSFPGKDQVADYLERYALHCDLPVRMSTRVDRLEAGPAAGSPRRLGEDTITCDNVVVATGTFGRTPNVPDFAADLDPAILQLHSSEYRRPDQLADGRVLVVGASHSGCDIAYEAAEHRPTTLAGRDCGQIPVRWESRRCGYAFPVLLFLWRHVVTRRTPIGRKEMDGDPPPRRPDAARQARRPRRRGVERVLRPGDRRQRRPAACSDDGRVVDAATVVWCTGFRQVFDWIDAAGLRRGRLAAWSTAASSTTVPGLFFCGLAFQYAFSSMVLPGRRPRRGVRRPPDRRAPRDPEPARGRCLSGRRAAHGLGILRRRGVRDGRGRRPGAGPGRPTSGGSGSRPTTRCPTSTASALDRRRLRPAGDDGVPPGPQERLRPGDAARLPGRTSTAARPSGAVRCAFWLGMVLLTSGEPAVGGGWVGAVPVACSTRSRATWSSAATCSST